MGNALLTSESSMLPSIGVFASLINEDLIGKVFTPTQQNENNVGMDCLFGFNDRIFVVQLKLKLKGDTSKRLSKQKQDMINFKTRNESNGFKNIIPLVVYGGFIDEEGGGKRLKLSFKRVNNNKNTTETEIPVSYFNFLGGNYKIFEDKIYSKYDDLSRVNSVSVSDWDDQILILCENGSSQVVNLDKLTNINLQKQ